MKVDLPPSGMLKRLFIFDFRSRVHLILSFPISPSDSSPFGYNKLLLKQRQAFPIQKCPLSKINISGSEPPPEDLKTAIDLQASTLHRLFSAQENYY